MGQIIKLSCSKCGYSMEANVGAGMGACNPMIIKGCLKGEELNKWNSLYDNQELAMFSSDMHIGKCPTCNTLRNIFLVKAVTKDDTHIELGGTCDVCDSKCTTCDDEDIVCPECKEAKLGKGFVGYWD